MQWQDEKVVASPNQVTLIDYLNNYLPKPGHINWLSKQLQLWDAKVIVFISLLPYFGWQRLQMPVL
jgi:hypothetical protein